MGAAGIERQLTKKSFEVERLERLLVVLEQYPSQRTSL